jgi:hypothetical protein
MLWQPRISLLLAKACIRFQYMHMHLVTFMDNRKRKLGTGSFCDMGLVQSANKLKIRPGGCVSHVGLYCHSDEITWNFTSYKFGFVIVNRVLRVDRGSRIEGHSTDQIMDVLSFGL